MKDQKKQIWSWALYDWANSAFATTVMAGFFPLFFKSYWANGLSVQDSTFYLGLGNSIASLIIVAIAPFLGAIADKGSAKKRFLFFFAYLAIVMTGGLWFVKIGLWPQAIVLYCLAMIGFSGANIAYDSLLVTVASKKKVSDVSSLGFSLGYIGGGILFLINVLMFQKPEMFGIPDGTTAVRLSFVSVAVWWAIFSLPVFLFVKEEKSEDNLSLMKAAAEGWIQLKKTIKKISYFKITALFLFAYWFYIDGVDTVIKMAVDYGTSLGFDSGSLIVALLIVQFVAFPSTLLFNLFTKKIGEKKALVTAICAYGIITIFAFFMKNETHFFICAMAVGLFQGGIQAISRSFYSRLIPEKVAGEFYGFYNMLGKFAAVLGPVLMGSITVITGSNRYGILSIIILFIVGGILLAKVDVKEGERIAKEYKE